MIRKPAEPPVLTLLVLAGVGLVLSLILWAWFFLVPLVRQGGGGLVGLPTSLALDCYIPWRWAACEEQFRQADLATSDLTRPRVWTLAPLMVGLLLAGVAAYEQWFAVRERIILAGMVVEDMAALLKAARREQRHNKYAATAGIHLFNGWRLSLPREANHLMIFGAPGSGKTVTFRRMINSVVGRGDKAIIFDEKGDYTRLVPPSDQAGGLLIQPIIIAPQDERSAVWDIAADLVVSQDAVELAHRIIPESGHPFFTQSARAILAGCAIKLMAEKPRNWTWLDLLNETRQDQETLLRIMLKYQRGADIFLTADYKQVMSTLGQLETHVRLLEMLATAWPDYEGRHRFCLREWLVNGTERRTVIIQHSGRYAELSDGWISALYAVAVSTVTDSNLLDDNDLRRIWFFLDEYGQLPAIKDFERFVTLGRSKGVCAVLGVQDLSQIEQTYSREILNTLMSVIGTKIVTRINLGPTAERLERDLGDTRYDQYRREMGTDGMTRWQKETHIAPPVERSEFATELGVDDMGVLAFVTGVGKNVYLVKFPFPEDNRDRRPASRPAAWTYTFKPAGTFSSDADIDRYVAAIRGHNSPPPRGPGETSLEEEFNRAAREAFDAAEAEAANASAAFDEANADPADLFGKYR
jgi:hypothetical protein